MTLAFVHVPKTGGTSLVSNIPDNEICKGHYKVSEFMEHDHAHGFATMIRDPYEIKMSTYFYAKRNVTTQPQPGPRYPMVSELYKQDLQMIFTGTIENYMQGCVQNSTYSFYYDLLTPKDFEFVGNIDNMKATRKLFKKMYGYKVPRKALNVNPNKNAGQLYERSYSRRNFVKAHSGDYDLYDEGLDRFYELCSEYNVGL